MMTDQQIIDVVQAHINGSRIECRDFSEKPDLWRETSDSPAWSFCTREYRVKSEPPKPREWWLYFWHGIEMPNIYSMRQLNVTADREVHVREVL